MPVSSGPSHHTRGHCIVYINTHTYTYIYINARTVLDERVKGELEGDVGVEDHHLKYTFIGCINWRIG